MLFDRGWPTSFISEMIEAYPEAIDIAKISAWHLHQREAIVQRKIAMYHSFGIETQVGGPVLEIARVTNKEDEILAYCHELGFDGVEVSSESLPTQSSIESDRRFADKCKALGFSIHGEVGKKFPEGDQVRLKSGRLDVAAASATFIAYTEMGCSGSYLEGHLLRAVCGDMGEVDSGWDDIKAVVGEVGLENVIFEVPGTYLPYAGKRALQGWLVSLFGPDVNIGNVLVEEIPELEEIRGGLFPTFGAPSGDHPWLHALARNGGRTVNSEWWHESD